GEEGAERGEQAVQEAGAAWTIVRASWFDQNFSEHYLLPGVLSGEVALPVGDMVEPFVDADDIAAVAVAALTDEGHAGRVYELTGPQLLTFADAVAEISHATSRDIRFVSVSMDEYVAMLVREGVPSEDIELIAYLFTEVLDGRNASLADGVQRALGRSPRDFRTYARDAAATGVWTVDEVAIR
ncbi:MAG: NmrA family transcriptional regulator, partial [Acidimicrobiia bacterium]